jgi:putative spermidine/putrescine transport system substrate-binding protein
MRWQPRCAGSRDATNDASRCAQNLSEAGYLYGPFATVLPNGALFDFTSPEIKYDFGHPTLGYDAHSDSARTQRSHARPDFYAVILRRYEMPYNKAQFTLIYNAALVGNTPPASVLELVAWIKAHPGKFAYPDPSKSFEASALLRHFFGAFCPPYADFEGDFNEALYTARTTSQGLWTQLNDLQPYLWVNATTGKVSPPAAGQLDDLFANGSLAFTYSYDPLRAASAVAAGLWNASTTRSYVFTGGNLGGTVANINFVAIPINAPNLAGALVAANALAAPAQQFARAHADVWGTFPAFAPSRMPEGWVAAFGEIAAVRSDNTPDFGSLAAHQLGELDADYGTRLERDWARFVNATVTPASGPSPAAGR